MATRSLMRSRYLLGVHAARASYKPVRTVRGVALPDRYRTFSGAEFEHRPAVGGRMNEADLDAFLPDALHPRRMGRGRQLAAKSCQSRGTPLSAWLPRSSNLMPDPEVRSRTVLVTRTSPGFACSRTRAPTMAAIPPVFPAIT